MCMFFVLFFVLDVHIIRKFLVSNSKKGYAFFPLYLFSSGTADMQCHLGFRGTSLHVTQYTSPSVLSSSPSATSPLC